MMLFSCDFVVLAFFVRHSFRPDFVIMYVQNHLNLFEFISLRSELESASH